MKESIKTSLIKASNILKKSGIETYKLDARLLAMKAFGLKHEELVFNEDKLVETSDFFNLIERRSKNEPISHILCKREFYGFDFKVTRDTLDPRPDSETLIEAVLDKFADQNSSLKILDLGTGTGCLIIALLKLYPNSSGLAVDISDKAIDIAIYNSKQLCVFDRIRFLKSDWLEKVDEKFDVIISNPPYISIYEKNNLQKELKYEPSIALFGGNDGLDTYRKISVNLKRVMNDDSYVFFEHGINQESDIYKILLTNGLETVRMHEDLSGIFRVIVAKRKNIYD